MEKQFQLGAHGVIRVFCRPHLRFSGPIYRVRQNNYKQLEV